MKRELFGRRVLRADGVFLCIAGSVAMTMDAVGHFMGAGPFAFMLGSPHSIGGFEAHGLALIVGVLIYRSHRLRERRSSHWLALVVHALLGGSNLLFWSSFQQLGVIPMGIITTSLHAVFAVLNAACAGRTGR